MGELHASNSKIKITIKLTKGERKEKERKKRWQVKNITRARNGNNQRTAKLSQQF
eukprot:c10877_g1_i1 orf=129-293(+)